jgi:hypothetical protein
MQRDFRFTLGEAMKKELIALIINVYKANSIYQKRGFISAARENLEVVRLLLRITKELKQVSLSIFISANEMIESISKQLTAWEKSQNNN